MEGTLVNWDGAGVGAGSELGGERGPAAVGWLRSLVCGKLVVKASGMLNLFCIKNRAVEKRYGASLPETMDIITAPGRPEESTDKHGEACRYRTRTPVVMHGCSKEASVRQETTESLKQYHVCPYKTLQT